MPNKRWNDAEKLTLLRTAIACSPNFKIDAVKVAKMWPGDDDKTKPTARSVRDNFRSIMNHAEDLEALRQIKQGATTKDEVEVDAKTDVNHTGLSALNLSPPQSPVSKNPVTPQRRGLSLKGKRSTTNKSSTGSKRKRWVETPCSEDDMTSANETTSGDEADIFTPTPLARKTLPVRKTRRAACAAPSDGPDGMESEEMDAGAKHQDTEGSDEEYDLAKEREEKAARKAKLARRARK
ncbi:hypothetical protein CLAIMM_04374 [Cladophialophora immunda]|nr:hypothetical protein CLAIMM_04374 [Cladophialophora immunda]